jgi:PAS domain S-box-containing protein
MGPASESWYQQIVESLPQLVWSSAPDGSANYASKRLLAYLGVTQEQVEGDGWSNALHPEDRASAHIAWRAALASLSEYRTEFRLRRHDGAYRWFEARAIPLYAPDGTVVQWFGANTDIHEQRAMREELRAEKLRLEKMAAASPQLLHSVNSTPEGHVTFPYVSPSFVKLFGISAERLAADGFALLSLYHPDDMAGVRLSVEESRKNLSPWRHEWRVRVPERGQVWVEGHSMPVLEPDGSITWHGSLNDISERKRAEHEIKTLNAELEQRVRTRTSELEAANRELEAFSYSVSHDLREPLRAINGFSRALVEDFGAELPEEARRYVDAIVAGATRMGRLIDDLLSFSRLARKALQVRAVDTQALVGECIAELSAADAPGVEIRVGALAPCRADPALLRQVFVNLLSNALKYSRKREKPRVEVDCRTGERGEIIYFVRDNGAGFDMQYAGKLFGVFQRLHRQDEFEGTGVGLAIVQRIVTRHGGRVWAEAAPDRGATFSFTLP